MNNEELDMQPAEPNDIVEGSCPVCDQDFSDNCPPDIDMDEDFDCPCCGTSLHVECSVSIEREYEITTVYSQEK